MQILNSNKFWRYVEPEPTSGCWIWIGARSTAGYAMMVWDKRLNYVHRLVMNLPKATIYHLCRVRSCVNPQHLEVVTRKENILRGIGPSAINARRVICKNGHKFTTENTYITPQNERACRKCKQQRKKWHTIQRRR